MDVEFGERTQDCSPGHTAKEGPHLVRTGASREFSRAAVPVWGFHEVGRGAQGAPSMGFSRQEYWSGLPFPSPPEDFPFTLSADPWCYGVNSVPPEPTC